MDVYDNLEIEIGSDEVFYTSSASPNYKIEDEPSFYTSSINPKEIKRNEYYETICRIIVGGNNHDFSVSFFNLEDVKRRKQSVYDKFKTKFKKEFKTDYKHNDVFMNEHVFKNIINSGYTTDDPKELNPLHFDKLVKIKRGRPREELYCL